MAKEIHPQDLVAAELIEALGDISVKGVKEDKNNISKKGIDNLIKIALEFLELKKNNESTYKVEDDPIFSRQSSPNQYVKYVSKELIRIFDMALKYENEEIKRHLILHSSRILTKALEGDDNWFIIQILFETRGYRGSFYWKLMDDALRRGSQLDKSLLIQHLVSVPQFAILEQKFDSNYLNDFITYHIFRIVQMIIDENDFATFSDVMDSFSNNFSFKDPVDIANDIVYKLYPHYYGLIDRDYQEKFEELNFLISRTCVRDLSKIPDFIKKLHEYFELILQKQDSSEDVEKITQILTKIHNKIGEFIISSKLFGVFFRIGTYIISKGMGYKKYLEKLWYYQSSGDERSFYINKTPVSDSIDWNTLFAIYSGIGSSIYDEIDHFDNFNYSKYRYEYYVMILLKLNKTISLPSKDDITKWNAKNEEYKSRYYYEYASQLPTDKFLEVLDNIILNKNDFLSVLRLDETDTIENRMNEIKKKLIGLKNLQEKTTENTVLYSKLNNQKIEEFKQQSIIGSYKKGSKIEKIAQINYDTNILDADCEVIQSEINVPRDSFIDQGIIAHIFNDMGFSSLAIIEIYKIYKKIKKNIKPVAEDGDDFLKQIQSKTTELKRKGFHPDTIFIPLNVETELMKKQHVMFYPERGLKVDDETTLYMINSWKNFDFTDIIIYDSTQLSVIYKALDTLDVVKITISDIEEGKKAVKFSSEIKLSITLTDENGFARIVNSHISKLNPDNPDI
ncbi:MAG: hypothetical protein ACW9W3_00980 [Candidatus Nitrosopumilus sp. bin_68KS]